MKKETDPAQLGVFDSGARARSSDPATSKAAARSVQKLRASQARVLSMFKLYGDMTDEDLTAYLHAAEKDAGIKLMSPSGVRSRRSELSKPNMDRMDEIAKGAVADLHEGTPTGYDSLTDEGKRRCRAYLVTEGVRAPLWDTGKRAKLTSGRMAIVWGIAR